MASALIAEPLGCLYIARCTVSGGVYVGITVLGFEARKRRHLSNAAAGLPYGLYRAIRKYGTEAFVWTIISDGHTWAELCQLEHDEIASLRAAGVKLYNMTKGGDGTKGWKLTPEISAKMSLAGKRRFQDPAQREWNRQKSLGVPNTAEQKAKISAALKGKQKSAETRANMSAAQKKRASAIIWTNEMRAEMSVRAKANTLSQQSRAKISAKLKGVPKSPETRQRMREAQLRRLGKL